MSLIIEDGSGLPDADSYVSVAQANAYELAYTASSDWASASDADKEIALRRATRYIDLHYGQYWRGARAKDTQSLCWPRSEVVDADDTAIAEDIVPTRVAQATIEAAIRFACGENLLADITQSAAIESETVKVGSISESVTYIGGGAIGTGKKYPVIDALLATLIVKSSEVRRS